MKIEIELPNLVWDSATVPDEYDWISLARLVGECKYAPDRDWETP